MKRSLTILASLICLIGSFAQTSNFLNYHTVLRDAAGNVRASEDISTEIAILQGSPTGIAEFTEAYRVTTNSFGLVNLEIGAKSPTDFTGIDWANGPYFMQIEVDGMVIETSQLLSVPFALRAKTTKSIDMTGNEAVFNNWDKNSSEKRILNQTISI